MSGIKTQELKINKDLFSARHCEVRSNLFALQSRSAYLEIASYLNDGFYIIVLIPDSRFLASIHFSNSLQDQAMPHE